MPIRWCRNILLICVMTGLAVSSCRSRDEQATPFAAYIPPGEVPPALETISEKAAAIVDFAAAGAWPQAYAYIGDIRDVWRSYKNPTVVPPANVRPPATVLYGELDKALARLADAAAAKNVTETMIAANDVDAAATDLREYYNPTIPTEFHRLAVLERKILADSWDGRIEIAQGLLSDARQAWATVRQTVVNRAGESVAAAFDRSLAAQQTAIDLNNSEGLGDDAENALIMIREMERLSY